MLTKSAVIRRFLVCTLTCWSQSYPSFWDAHLDLFWCDIEFLGYLLPHRHDALVWVTLQWKENGTDTTCSLIPRLCCKWWNTGWGLGTRLYNLYMLTHTNSVLPSRKKGEGTCAYTANSTDISTFEKWSLVADHPWRPPNLESLFTHHFLISRSPPASFSVARASLIPILPEHWVGTREWASLGPRPKTNPSADHFQYRYSGRDKHAGWCLGTRLRMGLPHYIPTRN